MHTVNFIILLYSILLFFAIAYKENLHYFGEIFFKVQILHFEIIAVKQGLPHSSP